MSVVGNWRVMGLCFEGRFAAPNHYAQEPKPHSDVVGSRYRPKVSKKVLREPLTPFGLSLSKPR